MGNTGAYALEGVDAALLHEVHQTYSAALFGELGQNPRWSETLAIATDLPTKGNVAKVKMGSRAYGIHEWLDERVKAKIQHFDVELEVKRWANAISLKIDDLEDDDLNLGMWRPLITEMGDDFNEHPHTLILDLISNGFATTLGTAYDGQAFFSASHPLPDGSTWSNIGQLAFSDDNLYAAILAMELVKKPNGLSANVVPTHLIAPAALRQDVEAVLLVEKETGGASNPLFKRLTPIIDPRLDAYSTTAWFLLDASKGLKPFFRPKRKAVTPQMDTKDLFEEGVVHWGAYARYNASYGFPQLMWGTDGVP